MTLPLRAANRGRKATLLCWTLAGLAGSLKLSWIALWLLFAWIVFLLLGAALPAMRLFGPFLCCGAGEKKRVALTFDDGPDPVSTPALLAWLRMEKLPATFFCVGKNVAAHPDLARQIVREGHLIENHSFSHKLTTPLYSSKRLCLELALTQKIIEDSAGTKPLFYRPPYGFSSPRVFKVAGKLGLAVIGWNAGNFDTLFKNPKSNVDRIERRLRPGAIIMLHDGKVPPERLIETVALLLKRLRACGYEVVSLDQILKGND